MKETPGRVPYDAVLRVRMYQEDLGALRRAAEREDLSAWVRRVLLKAAREAARREGGR